MTAAKATLADLLAHAAWVRRIASRLVNDADVDDAVQETWVAALRCPPGDARNPRGWLGRVLGNVVRGERRASGRRRMREQGAEAQLGRTVAKADDLIVDAELHRMLARLVTELEEPFRGTILLHFFEGLASADIARRNGLPDGTVRSRVKEGLRRLRAALDDRYGGDGSAWRAALIPIVPAARSARSIPWWATAAMLSATAAAVVIVVDLRTAAFSSAPLAERPLAQRRAVPSAPAEVRTESAEPDSPGNPDLQDMRRFVGLLAAVHHAKPPGSAARAKALWERSCASPGADGLCVTAVEPPEDACPQRKMAGEGMVRVEREPEARAESLAIFRTIAERHPMSDRRGDEARLRLADDAFERLLSIAPPRDLTYFTPDDAEAKADQKERVRAWLVPFSAQVAEVGRAYDALAQTAASAEIRHLALARAGVAAAEAARLELSMGVPAGLPEKDWDGKRPQDKFCASIASQAQRLFARGERFLERCAREATGGTSATCRRELARLPPPFETVSFTESGHDVRTVLERKRAE